MTSMRSCGEGRRVRDRSARFLPGLLRPAALPAFPALLVVLGLPGCGDGSPGALEPLQELPRELTVAEREVVSSSNAFGLELFGRLADEHRDENLVFSPLSAHLALGMTANGANGETLAAMRETLGQGGLSEEEANGAYRGLLDLLPSLDPGVELEIANSIWHRLALPVRPAFVDLSRRTFDAEVRGLDFGDPGAADSINDWVEDRTRGKITDLIDRIRPDEVMFLVNAVYFRGEWRFEFDPDETREAPFRRPDGSSVDVPMMSRDFAEVRHQRTDAFEAVDLPYGRGAYVMTLLLPAEGTAPADLLDGLDAETWASWMDGFAETRARVSLPRFRVEWEKLLNDALKAMGMEVAFDPDRADLLRLVEEGFPENLYISRVKQKAFIEVDEEGTEAAAATSVGVGVTSAPPTFRADRPFLYAIRERFSGTVLFIGQVTDPTAG